LKDKRTVNLVARKTGYRRTDYYAYNNWFENEGCTYRVQSTLSPKVLLSEPVGGNDGSNYAGHIVIGDEVVVDSLVYALVGIEDGTFRNATSLRSIIIESNTIESIGRELFYGCSALNAVTWNIALPISADMFDVVSYYNLLVYAPTGTELSHQLIDEGRMALIVDGKSTAALQLNARMPFYCPRSFVVDEVSYQRTFTQSTGRGEAAGWETIALPFNVDNFEHSVKGEIAPFGVDAKYNFWLAGLDGEGFKQATSIRANAPYIIAMPNHNDYGSNSMNGTVTFSASQATICATDELAVSEGSELVMIPTYETIEPNAEVYALNVGAAYNNNKAGSVFLPNKYAVAPFSAYVVPAEGTKAAPLYRIYNQPDVEEQLVSEVIVEARDGVVYISVPEAKTVVVYDLAGRQVCNVDCKEGVNEITHLQRGIYLIENAKVNVQY
jgi:hypothetical protein